MSTLFSERFQGHESPVGPGIWDGIQQQLAVGRILGIVGIDFRLDRFLKGIQLLQMDF